MSPCLFFTQRCGPFKIWQLQRAHWSTHGAESIGTGVIVPIQMRVLLFHYFSLYSASWQLQKMIQWNVINNGERVCKAWNCKTMHALQITPMKINPGADNESGKMCVYVFVLGLLPFPLCVHCLYYVPLLLTRLNAGSFFLRCWFSVCVHTCLQKQ